MGAQLSSAVIETYESVIEDLNQSEFANKRGAFFDPLPYHLDELARLIARVPPGGRYLDVGVGYGIVPETMLRLGYAVVGIDYAPEERHKESLQRLIDIGAEGHFAYVGRDPIEFPDEYVDAAFASDVVEHLPCTPKYFLEELLRVLRPGGFLILSTPNAVRLTVRLEVLLGHSNWPSVFDYIDNPHDYMAHRSHHKEYTAREMVALLSHFGLEGVRVTMSEDRLIRRGLVRSLSDLTTKDRPFAEGGERISSIHPMEFARQAGYWLTKAFPGLKSVMIVEGRKPS